MADRLIAASCSAGARRRRRPSLGARSRAGVHRPPGRPVALERRTSRRPPARPARPSARRSVVGRRRPGLAAVGLNRRSRARSGRDDPCGQARYTRAMSVRPIVLLGDPRLRLVGQPVDSFGKYLHELLDDLAETMRKAPGVGSGRAAARRGRPRLHDRSRGPAARAGEPAHRPGERRRPRPRGLPLDPGLRGLHHATREGLGRGPEPPRKEDQGRRLGHSSAGPSSTRSTTWTASSTSTTSTRWTS